MASPAMARLFSDSGLACCYAIACPCASSRTAGEEKISSHEPTPATLFSILAKMTSHIEFRSITHYSMVRRKLWLSSLPNHPHKVAHKVRRLWSGCSAFQHLTAVTLTSFSLRGQGVNVYHGWRSFELEIKRRHLGVTKKCMHYGEADQTAIDRLEGLVLRHLLPLAHL